ncbi:MAG: hypothetical protein WBP93_18440, partial [Pyrinomonadaceae bacterium]
VAEGGFDEMVLSTDPKHKERTSRLLASFIDRASIFPKFEAGGWTNNLAESFMPPVTYAPTNNYSQQSSSSSSLKTENHYHIHVNVKANSPRDLLPQRSQAQIADGIIGFLEKHNKNR